MLVPRKKGLATTIVLKSESRFSRTLADSQQPEAENNHEIKQEFKTKFIEKRDGKAEHGRICELESKMVDHDNCCRGVVTVRGAEKGQHVEISH